jgi:dihydrodipicolinate reductase
VLESQVTVTLPFPSGTAVKLAQALLVIVTLAAITGAAVTHRSAATARDAGVGTKSVRYMSGFLE